MSVVEENSVEREINIYINHYRVISTSPIKSRQEVNFIDPIFIPCDREIYKHLYDDFVEKFHQR